MYSQQGPPAGAKKDGKKSGFRGPNIAPIAETGFEPMFDGKSLKGWDGDAAYWRVENGVIVGETTAANPLKQNTFLIYRASKPADFELKLDYKLSGHNSGIQIRSSEREDFKYGMIGYQADIDGEQRYTGQWYEERGRGFLAMRGQFTWVGADGKPGLVGALGESDELKALIKTGDWNSIHIVARGNTILQFLNGRLMSQLIDDDTKGRKMDGLIGIQCHVGPPMKIELRNVRIKKL
ncbi:MAG: DUF1080 domain-containing protein [Acidobacteria bacterium]|nr:DUF1080 domain-containing protein [Acidobacteriota bacterium]